MMPRNVASTYVRNGMDVKAGARFTRKNGNSRHQAQEQQVAERVFGEAGVDLLAERAQPLACGVGEDVTRGEEHDRRPDRGGDHDQRRADPAAEDEAHRQRQHQAAGQAERDRAGVDEERDDQRSGVVRLA